MRITILTVGSRGDVQPFIALGLGLQQAGHRVQLATHSPFQAMIHSYGLEFAPIEGDVQALMAGEAGQQMLDAGNPLQLIQRYAQMVEPLLAQAMADSGKRVTIAMPLSGLPSRVGDTTSLRSWAFPSI
jgi:UDP:flavonoid glycosyltransferase YjiC (YdhE family)